MHFTKLFKCKIQEIFSEYKNGLKKERERALYTVRKAENLFHFCQYNDFKNSFILLTFSFLLKENTVLRLNFRNGDFDGFTRFEVP